MLKKKKKKELNFKDVAAKAQVGRRFSSDHNVIHSFNNRLMCTETMSWANSGCIICKYRL